MAVLELVDIITTSLDNRETQTNLLLYLSKAFETLEHNIHLSKLSNYGITNTV